MQILHIVDCFVCYTVCFLDYPENLLPHTSLYFWLLGQLEESAGHGSDAGLATGYKEDRRLCEKSVSLES